MKTHTKLGRLDHLRVLLVAPRFFGYERDIRTELESRGALVDWLPDRPFDTPAMSALTKLRPQWVLPAADRLYQQRFNVLRPSSYDIVLVVNGQTLSSRMLTALRSANPGARFVLYLWDSLANRDGVIGNLNQFDRVCTFDPVDAKHFGLSLRPLFFGPAFTAKRTTEPFLHHLSFIGTAHTDRYEVVTAIQRGLDSDIRAYWYLYLQAPWVFHAYRWTRPGMRGARIGDFKFVPLDKAEVQRVFAGSLAVVDIEHQLQRGLTMRTFETLGSGRKLLTTNRHIAECELFRPENICIIDRRNPSIPRSFFDTPFIDLSSEMQRRYSISGWLDDVLDIKSSGTQQAHEQ